jgi:hypothetical protein
MYHDTAKDMEIFQQAKNLEDAEEEKKVLEYLKSTPWTIRCVFRTNELTQTNFVEIKRMVPTLNDEGLVGSWAPASTGAVKTSTACPFVKCAATTFDDCLGMTFVEGREVAAVRVLVVINKSTTGTTVAAPDPANLGLRVQRLARCGLESDAETSYLVKTAGVTADVQWLLTAQAGDAFLLTATLQGAGDSFAFSVLSHLALTEAQCESMSQLMLNTIQQTQAVLITHSADASPQRRLRDLVGESDGAAQVQPLTKRRRLC